MRADEAYTEETWLAENITRLNVEQVNQLRVERLMSKARELRNKAWYYVWLNNDKTMIDKCQRIAEALEERARRIKEE